RQHIDTASRVDRAVCPKQADGRYHRQLDTVPGQSREQVEAGRYTGGRSTSTVSRWTCALPVHARARAQGKDKDVGRDTRRERGAAMKQTDPIKFFSKLKWIDERALTDVIESYRRDIFERALYAFDGERPKYNLILTGRAKKNWKSADLILAALYKLLAWRSAGGNQCYALANDLDQANDNLELAKKIVAVNPPIKD